MENKIIYYMDKINKLKFGEYVSPISCEIDPSNKCPLSCNFCLYKKYNEENRVNLPWDVYYSVIHQLKAEGVKSITFTGGGEPTCNPRINSMIDLALSLDFEIGMITNGVLVDRIKYPEKFKFIRISINAGNAGDYQKITRTGVFETVVNNTKTLIDKGAFVGWSFVVSPDNKESIGEAKFISKVVGVKYIQYKPAWIDGSEYTNYKIPGSNTTIDTERYKAEDNLPCLIAHLVPVVGADAKLYYCCQKRGIEKWSIGSLQTNSFRGLWQKRLEWIPHSVESCPNCRYMNYVHAYEKLFLDLNALDRHINFL